MIKWVCSSSSFSCKRNDKLVECWRKLKKIPVIQFPEDNNHQLQKHILLFSFVFKVSCSTKHQIWSFLSLVCSCSMYSCRIPNSNCISRYFLRSFLLRSFRFYNWMEHQIQTFSFKGKQERNPSKTSFHKAKLSFHYFKATICKRRFCSSTWLKPSLHWETTMPCRSGGRHQKGCAGKISNFVRLTDIAILSAKYIIKYNFNSYLPQWIVSLMKEDFEGSENGSEANRKKENGKLRKAKTEKHITEDKYYFLAYSH